MDGFKVCANGHYYQEALDECPYCPKNQNNMDKTKIDNPNGNLSDKTQIFTPSGNQDLNKTQIFQGGNQNEEATFSSMKNTSGRKLVGWLVSFTMDENGVDFRLYEGRNIIGSDPACDIVVANDHTVSLKHLTILFRMGVYKFKDEMSTNGTFINEEFMEEGNLIDGDMVKVGNTVFRFRTV
jgi:hypothetical protein